MDKDLYKIEKTEDCLKNGYLHEGKVYNFFLDKVSDAMIDKHVVKSYGSGISDNGIITVVNNLNSPEEVNLFDNRNILQLYQRYIKLSNKCVYITTEYNPEYVTLDKGFILTHSKSNIMENFINSTLQALIYLHKTYNFCHWDFHFGNILYDRRTGDIKLFDFDHSTLDTQNNEPYLKNSIYIHFVPYFYTLIRYLINKYSFLSDDEYYQVKIKLTHFYDIYRFLESCQNDRNIEISNPAIFGNNILIQSFLEIYDIMDWLKDNIKEFYRQSEEGISVDEIIDGYPGNLPHIIKKYIVLYIQTIISHITIFGYEPYWLYSSYILGACILLEDIQEKISQMRLSIGTLTTPVPPLLFTESHTSTKSNNNESKKQESIPKNKPKQKYKKNIVKCEKGESSGGYKIKELREISKGMGIDIRNHDGDLKKKADLCREIRELIK